MIKLLTVFINLIMLCAANGTPNGTANNEIEDLSPSNQLRLKVMLFFKCLEQNGVLNKVVMVNDQTNGVHLMKTVEFDTTQNTTDTTYAKIMKCREDYLDRMPLTISPVGDSYASVNALAADADVYEAVAKKDVTDGRMSSFAQSGCISKRWMWQDWYYFFIGGDPNCHSNESFHTVTDICQSMNARQEYYDAYNPIECDLHLRVYPHRRCEKGNEILHTVYTGYQVGCIKRNYYSWSGSCTGDYYDNDYLKIRIDLWTGYFIARVIKTTFLES